MNGKGDRTGLAFLVLILLMVLLAGDTEVFRTALLGFSGIILEALPFMLAGAAIGGFIESFLPREILHRLKGSRLRTVMLAALAGVFIPVCECAIVPVLYRLLRKGLPPEAGLAYLFAGPIVNPVVFLSTLTAYRFQVLVPLVRSAVGFSCAVTAALAISAILRGRITKELGGDAVLCDLNGHGRSSKLVQAAVNAAEDLFTAGKFFVMGAVVASLLQSFLGRDVLLGLSNMPYLSIAGMMALGFVLSICSDGDAFVAASFGKSFVPFSSQIAFMVMGPMLDLKLLMMYRMVFPRRTVLVIIPVLALTVFLHSAAIQLLAELL